MAGATCFTSLSGCMLVALCWVQLCLAAVYNVVDVNGKWGVSNYFQAGDALSFSHNTHGGADVHEVSSWKEYKACHTSRPLHTLKHDDAGGRTSDMKAAALIHSGRTTFYFISADKRLCRSGRRLMVVVHTGSVAPSPNIATPPVAAPPPKAPAPTAATPVLAPETESPTPGTVAPPVTVPGPSTSPGVVSSSPVGGPGSATSGPAAAASPLGSPPPPTAPSTPPSAAVSLCLPVLMVVSSAMLSVLGPQLVLSHNSLA